jgi:hypothetical protein
VPSNGIPQSPTPARYLPHSGHPMQKEYRVEPSFVDLTPDFGACCREPLKNLSEEDRESRAKSLFSEYASSRDVAEATACVEELTLPGTAHLLSYYALHSAYDALPPRKAYSGCCGRDCLCGRTHSSRHCPPAVLLCAITRVLHPPTPNIPLGMLRKRLLVWTNSLFQVPPTSILLCALSRVLHPPTLKTPLGMLRKRLPLWKNSLFQVPATCRRTMRDIPRFYTLPRRNTRSGGCGSDCLCGTTHFSRYRPPFILLCCGRHIYHHLPQGTTLRK